MKKNENILQYVEKYKEKYGIKYAQKNSKSVKGLSVAFLVSWVYSFLILFLWTISFTMNFANDVHDFSDYKEVFVVTVAAAVLMLVSMVFYIFKKKVVSSAVAAFVQPFVVASYARISVYGMGYIASFYWAFLVPACLVVIFAAALMFILIRAEVKTNKLYKKIVDGLYDQYSTKDGEKLTEEQWQEFLSCYNPYKKD